MGSSRTCSTTALARYTARSMATTRAWPGQATPPVTCLPHRTTHMCRSRPMSPTQVGRHRSARLDQEPDSFSVKCSALTPEALSTATALTCSMRAGLHLQSGV